ncbi:hypothetical protein [Olivibacter oleidegradans]
MNNSGLTHFSERRLKKLAKEFDRLMCDINAEVWLMNQSQGVEYYAFLFSIDPSMVNVLFTETNTPVSYRRERVVHAVDNLRVLWKRFHLWYFNEQLIPAGKWKIMYNEQAKQAKDWILLLE